jgi:hypothetical protein
MQWNWVYEMVVIISGLDDGQWYQGTESMRVQISLQLPGLPITRETSLVTTSNGLVGQQYAQLLLCPRSIDDARMAVGNFPLAIDQHR